MNILYINHYAGSPNMGMEFRPYYLAKEWNKSGNRVTIIGGNYSHLRKINPEVKKDFQTQDIDGLEYVWLKTGSYSGNGIKRAWTMFRFVTKLYVKSGKIAKKYKPDIVIASSTYPLDTYAAHRIARKAKAKYVHEVHDMWPITPIELYGMSPKNPFVVMLQHAEDYFCVKADKVVSVLPCAKDYFVEHGMKDTKFLYVPNGIDLSDWGNPEELPELHLNAIEKAHHDGRFVLAFFGSHTKSYSLDYLIKAIKETDQSKIFVAFVGEGNYKETLKSLANGLGISDQSYCFLPSINKKAIPSLLSICDALYIGAIKNRMFRFGIGMNKLFDAMMSGKPILYAVDAPNDFVKEYNCGVSVTAEDVEALKDGINKLINMDSAIIKELGENGKNAAISYYTYPVLAEKFLNGVCE